MYKTVGPEGPKNAEIACVGESPGRFEIYEGRPFVGPAGQLSDQMMARVGLRRSKIYMTNVMKVRPPKDDFKTFWKDSKQTEPTQELKEGILALYSELEDMPNLKVIITYGRQPTYILTGKDGITKWRGSILELNRKHIQEFYAGLDACKISTNETWNKSVIVIPTYHPAALTRMYGLRPFIECDLKRAKDEVGRMGLEPNYSLIPSPKYYEVIYNLNYILGRKVPITVDIECIKGTHSMFRIGLGTSFRWAISIPFLRMESLTNWWTLEEECEIWRLLGLVMRSPIPKVFQNSMFDVMWLEAHGLVVNNIWHDTKNCQRVILPGLPGKVKPYALGPMTTMYTRVNFYKDDGKVSKKDSKVSDEKNGIYNAKDCVVTYEIMEKQRGTRNFKMNRPTFERAMSMIRGPIHYMMKRGVKIDTEYKARKKIEFEQMKELLDLRANHLLGRNVNLGSPVQMKSIIYDELGLRGPLKRKTGEVEIKILHAKYPECKLLGVLLPHRKITKCLTNYWNMKVDSDSRARTQYDVAAVTGRLTSSTNPFGSGANLQNQDRSHGVRRMFVADPGMTLIAPDLDQAESRAIAYFSNCYKLIDMLEDKGIDAHWEQTREILGDDQIQKLMDERGLSKKEIRQLGKRVVHAADRMISSVGLVEACRKELDINITRTFAQSLLNSRFARYPEIRSWHKGFPRQRATKLRNPLGRETIIYAYKPSDAQRYIAAWYPQSFIGDLLNVILDRIFKKLNCPGRFELLLQTHDGFVVQVPDAEVDQHIRNMRPFFDVHTPINGHDVVIPVSFEVGKNWEDLKPWEEK